MGMLLLCFAYLFKIIVAEEKITFLFDRKRFDSQKVKFKLNVNHS